MDVPTSPPKPEDSDFLKQAYVEIPLVARAETDPPTYIKNIAERGIIGGKLGPERSQKDSPPDLSKLGWLDLHLPTRAETRDPFYLAYRDPQPSGHDSDDEPEVVYSTLQRTITPTTDCVLKEGSLEGSEVFINTFEFNLEENQTVHQLFLKSKSKYLAANLYCDGLFRLDWYTEHDEMMAQLMMTPRQHEMYNTMVGPRPTNIEGQEVEYTLPLRAGNSSEKTFKALSKLYKNWKIEYEFSDQIPGNVLYIGLLVRETE